MTDTENRDQRATDDALDFAIVTAKNIERDAVLKRLDHYVPVTTADDPYVYYRGYINIPGDTNRYEVVVVRLINQGNVEAAAETTELIHRWKPQHILMVGIAGGISEKGVAKGDVVVAEYVHYYELGKRTPQGEQRRPKHYRCDRVLFGKAYNYEAAEWKSSVNVKPPAGSDEYVPHAHFGPIGSGEKVIGDVRALSRLLKENPQMLAVAMEGAGVAQSTENAGISFLEIRGISDTADVHKTDDWQEYAANAAAAFTVGFLRSKPVSTLDERLAAMSGKNRKVHPTLAILRVQSLRQIGADEILESLPADLLNSDRELFCLDFTDLVVGPERRMVNPEAAVQRLLDPNGPLMAALGRRGAVRLVFHGLVHIPIAVLIGYLVSDRQLVTLFDFHPAPGSENWTWPNGEETYQRLNVSELLRRRGSNPGEAVVRVSVSYLVTSSQTLPVVPHPDLEIDLSVPTPSRSVVRSEAQTRDYGHTFRQTIDHIANDLRDIKRIHLFYAGPVALAFHIGQQISENIHPPVTVWNYRQGDYEWGIDLGAISSPEKSVVRPTTAE